MSEIKLCVCNSEFQDKRYGKKKRIFTFGKKGLTCTVCGRRV